MTKEFSSCNEQLSQGKLLAEAANGNNSNSIFRTNAYEVYLAQLEKENDDEKLIKKWIKKLRPIDSWVDMQEVLDNSVNQMNTQKARRGHDQNAKRNLVQLVFQTHGNPDGTLKGSTSLTNLVAADIDFDPSSPTFKQDVLRCRDNILKHKDEIGLVWLSYSVSKGLHIAFRRNYSMTQEENLRWFEGIIGEKVDDNAKDITRCMFTTTSKDVIFHDDDVLFNYTEPENGVNAECRIAPQPSSINENVNVNSSNLSNSSVQTHYKGVPLTAIAQGKLLEDGWPVEGERHTRLFALGREFASICDYNVAALVACLPTLGLDQSEILNIAKSACDNPLKVQTKAFREFLAKTLNVNVNENDDENENEDEAEKKSDFDIEILPSGLLELVRLAPNPSLHFPALAVAANYWATLLSPLRAEYNDGEEQSPSLITAVVGRQASGKSFITRFRDILFRKIKRETDRLTALEQQWKDEDRRCANDQQRPENQSYYQECSHPTAVCMVP